MARDYTPLRIKSTGGEPGVGQDECLAIRGADTNGDLGCCGLPCPPR